MGRDDGHQLGDGLVGAPGLVQRQRPEDADRVGAGELPPGTVEDRQGLVVAIQPAQRAAVLAQALPQFVAAEPEVERPLVEPVGVSSSPAVS